MFHLSYNIPVVSGGGGGGGAGGGGGGGRDQLPIYDIVQICVPNRPLVQRCQVYDKPPFF